MADILAVRQRRHPVARVFGERLLMRVVADHHFVARYRFDKATVAELIEMVGGDLYRNRRGGQSIPVETQVLASLRYLAKGAFYSEIGDTHGISRSSVSRISGAFVDSVNEHLDNIRFPVDRQSVLEVKRSFFDRCHLPNIVGAVDGTLVPIVAPHHDEKAYVCRKGYHAINCQVVSDSNMRILDVVANWPGSTHDAAVFDSCGLKDHLEGGANMVLLGDSGYALRTYMMTPLLAPTTANEERFNRRQKRGREVVERAFGLLKSRFRCLHRTGGVLPFKPRKCAKVMEACCRLHNLCMDRAVAEPALLPEAVEEGQEEDIPAEGRRGQEVRQVYIDLL